MTTPPSITLRARIADDADVLYGIAAELDTWEERGAESPRALTRAAYDARVAPSDSETSGATTYFVIDADGDAVGYVLLFGVDHLARHAEVGIALAAAARGRGIGTAALSQLVGFAFVRCNLRRLHLEVIESNGAAIRSYEKAGFVIEGRQREHAWVRGRYEDIVRMGLLRSDWSPIDRDPDAS